MIIDDEPLAIQRLERLLAPHRQHIQITDTARNGKEAVRKIRLQSPDLVFLDIQMPGLNGFEVLDAVDPVPWVIFCTAYDEYALKAFETHAVDYLLKPVEPGRLAKALNRLQHLSGAHSLRYSKKLAALMDHLNPSGLKRIGVPVGHRIHLLNMTDIAFFRSSHKYVEVHTAEQCYLISQSLQDLENHLPEDFVRIHRGSIVNLNFVAEIIREPGSPVQVRVRDKNSTLLRVSRASTGNLGL